MRNSVLSDQWTRMRQDAKATGMAWQLWLLLGWNDIATQYRRSFLGPIWITLSTGLFVFAFGLLGAQLFGQSAEEFLPYFAVGYVIFTFFSNVITDGCDTFSSADSYLRHGGFPKLMFPLRVLVRNLVLLGHNLVIILLVLLWAGLLGDVRWLQALAALLLCLPVAVCVVVILGCLSARFRDVPMMVRSIMQIMFFMTPVFWSAEALSERAALLVLLNPLALFLDLLRAPLLGQWVMASHWINAIGWLLGVSLVAGVVFLVCRRRLVYWV